MELTGNPLYKFLGVAIFGAAFFVFALYYNKKFLEWLRFQSLGTRDYITETLALMFIEVQPHHVLIGLFAVSFGLGALVFVALMPQLFAGFLMGSIVTIIGWKTPKPIVQMMYRRRCKAFVWQMVDALALMANGMKSGLSIVQSMGMVASQMPNPIQQEFNLVLNENKLGVSLEEAFVNLSKRIKADDVEMFVTSVVILKETGGNLAETFETIVNTIRSRVQVESKIDAMTTQGMMQGYIVLCVPPILGFVIYQTDPDMIRPLFTTPLGWVVLSIVVILEVGGYISMRKIVKIDV